jgi:hypothetical protein
VGVGSRKPIGISPTIQFLNLNLNAGDILFGRHYLIERHIYFRIYNAEWRAHMAEGVADDIICKLKEIAHPYHPQFLNSKFGHPKLSKKALKL